MSKRTISTPEITNSPFHNNAKDQADRSAFVLSVRWCGGTTIWILEDERARRVKAELQLALRGKTTNGNSYPLLVRLIYCL